MLSSRNICWFHAFALTAILVATATASPPPGSVDPSFDPGRGPTKVNPGRGDGPVIQPDGKILVGGDFNALNLTYVPPILRFNPDGSLDPSFASILTPARFDIFGHSSMYPLALQPNGQILIGGRFTRPDGSIQYLVRLNANGSLDSAFHPRFEKSKTSPAIWQATILPGGKILVAGTFDSVNGVLRPDMVRLNTDGSLDTSFTPSIAGLFGLQSSGKIIVRTVDSVHRLNSDGSSDNSFHAIITTPSGGPPALSSLVVRDDKILFSYVYTFGGYAVIGRLQADGQNDLTFEPYHSEAHSEAWVVLVQDDGGILINSFSGLDPGRLKPNGEPDWDFQRDHLTYSVAQQSDRKLVVASNFWPSPPFGIRRVFLDGVPDPSFAPDVGLTVIMQAASGNVALMPNGKIVVAGDFNYIDRLPRETIAVLNHDGTPYEDFNANDLVLAKGLYASITVVAAQPNGKILAALLMPAQLFRNQKILRLNHDGSLDGSFYYEAPGPNEVRSIVVQPNGKILVDCQSELMRINPDGTRDATFSPAEPARLVLLQPDGKLLVDNGAHGLRRLNPDGSPDAGFSPAGMNAYNPPWASAIQPDGKYLASHRDILAFRTVFVRLDRDGSRDGTFAPDVNAVSMVALDQAGIYAAGQIEPFGAEPHLGICRFNSDGSRDPNFNVEFNPDTTLSQLLLQPDGQLLITGTFDQVQGAERRGIARINGSAPNKVANISTRARIGKNEDVGIGGFIVTGSAPKKIIVRAVGPSLQASGLPASATLSDPRIELRDAAGAFVALNNNWRDTQENEITASGFSMGHDLEAAILVTVPPGRYTAIVAGADSGEGVALVEVYDLDPAADSALANISTRSVVHTGDNLMIGGFILRGSQSPRVAVRALGPSLAGSGITAVLADPTLELHDQSGAIIASNNDWKETQQAELEELGFALDDDRESALIATLPPGPYTAVVRGNERQTGVGLLEVYKLP